MPSSKVSVIIPTFRRLDAVEKAVASVLAQTHSNLEIIVVNDCEEELLNLKECLAKFNDDSRLSCLNNQRTKGGNGARNTGTIEATGDYIAFLDDDDIFLSNKLEVQLKHLKDNELDGSFTGFKKLNRSTGNYIIFDELKREITIFNFIKFKIPIGASSTLMFKKEVFDRINWDESLYRLQDFDLMIKVLKNFKIGFCEKALVEIPMGNQGFKFTRKHFYSIKDIIVRFASNYYKLNFLLNFTGALFLTKSLFGRIKLLKFRAFKSQLNEYF